MKNKVVRYCTGLLATVGLFAIANILAEFRSGTCSDCSAPHGVPFTYYHEGGFAGGAEYLLVGIAGDIAVVLGVAAGLGWIMNRLATRYPKAYPVGSLFAFSLLTAGLSLLPAVVHFPGNLYQSITYACLTNLLISAIWIATVSVAFNRYKWRGLYFLLGAPAIYLGALISVAMAQCAWNLSYCP